MIRMILRILNLASGSIPSRSKRHLIAPRPVRDHENEIDLMLNPAFGSTPPRELVNSRILANVLASPSWLIPDVLQRNALIQLFGEPGTGKSLLALDIALCVAAQQQNVVYVAAEAPDEHIPRLAAWEGYYRQSPDHLYFWLHPLELANRSNVAEFVGAIRALNAMPALIIIDPLASCMVGLEENATGDMVRAIESLNLLRAATGAAILIVHHTGWERKHERGSSALRAACRVVLKLSANGGGTVNLTSEKTNNGKSLTRSFEIAKIANQRGDSAVVLKALANHNTGLNWQVITNSSVSASPAASP